MTAHIVASADVDQRRPNFAADVAPILYANCVVCHRPEQQAPFSLLSYDDVKSRGVEIRKAVTSREMPPWNAAAASGFPALLHDRRLSARQIETISSWVGAGMPPGDLSKVPLPPSFPASWPLGLPDLTVSLPRPMSIPADTADRVFNVVLYMNFPVDRWITAIDYQPSSRDLLSHAIVFAVPAATAIDEEDVLPGFGGLMGANQGRSVGEDLLAVDRSLETIGVWTPAGRPSSTPDGAAVRLARGSNIVMQFHARAADTGAIEDGTVAIYFAKTRPPVSLSSLQVPPVFGVAAGINLPAGDPRVVVTDELTLPVDVTAFGARGHGHRLAREFKMTARLPNGTTKGLLWIDRWDVDRQETYYFNAPVKLPKGTAVRVEMTYDNSSANPSNRVAPPRRVTWGSRLSDEVGSMDLVIAAPEPGDAAALAAARAAHFREQLVRQGRSEKAEVRSNSEVRTQKF